MEKLSEFKSDLPSRRLIFALRNSLRTASRNENGVKIKIRLRLNFSVVQSIGFANSAPRIPSGRLPCREWPFVWVYNQKIQLHTCIDAR